MSQNTDEQGTLVHRNGRWRAELDPRLPATHIDRDATLFHTVRDTVGAVVAHGYSTTVDTDPGTLAATWGPLRQFQLRAVLDAADRAQSLAALLRAWSAYLPAAPGTTDVAPSDLAHESAVVTWPARDIETSSTLRAFGFQETTVLATRSPAASTKGPISRPSVSTRPLTAAASDLDTATELWLGEVRYDARFGAVHERPATAGLVRSELEHRVADAGYAVWLAEVDAMPVGLLVMEWPESTGWLATALSGSAVGYIGAVYVRPEFRGRGVASVLVDLAHRRLAEAGAATVALHFAVHNPLSPTFWTGWGYDPLWTVWQAHPARVRAAA